MANQQVSVLPSNHQDLISDIAFDYYGTRLATSGADQKIKIWKQGSTNEWTLEEDWKAHDSPITGITWSHPEHGPVLASSSYDRTIRIWEENLTEPVSGGKRWSSVCKIPEPRGTVLGVEFAPPEFGLRLASISTDCHLRVYASSAPTLDEWYIHQDIDVTGVLSAEPTDGGATGGSAKDKVASGDSASVTNGGWCISFCKEKWLDGMAIAVGCGNSSTVKVISLPSVSTQHLLFTLTPQPASSKESDAITTVAWAPACGRSYHLIATGSRDGWVRIWKITLSEDGNIKQTLSAQFDDHRSCIGSVQWNNTGTKLSSAGEDGKVRVWQATYADQWQKAAEVSASPGPVESH